MNRSMHDDVHRDAIVNWAQDMTPPAFDLAAIRRRAFLQAEQPSSHPKARRAALAVLAGAVAALAAIPAIPAIVNNVSRAFHAFVITNGQVHRATTREATLDEARTDMPFYVIEPAGIPASLHGTITEVFPSADRTDAQLWFEYNGSEPMVHVTIVETSASSRYAPPASTPHGSSELTITQTRDGKYVTGGAMITGTAPTTCISISIVHNGPQVRISCRHPSIAGNTRGVAGCRSVESGGRVETTCTGSGQSRSVIQRSGVVRRAGTFVPVRWVAHGTLVVLYDASGALTKRQVEALRAAMSR